MNRKMFLFLIFSVINTQVSAMLPWLNQRCDDMRKAKRESQVPSCGERFDCSIGGKPLTDDQQKEFHERRKELYPELHADKVMMAISDSDCIRDTFCDNLSRWGHDHDADSAISQKFGSQVSLEKGNVAKAYTNTLWMYCFDKHNTPALREVSWRQAGEQACGQMNQQNVLVMDITQKK